jgi:hypothetical protein
VSHVTGYPFQKISIDFVGPLPRSKKGNEYMLTVSDCLTRWLEAFPCRRANAQVVVDKLVTEIFLGSESVTRFTVTEVANS